MTTIKMIVILIFMSNISDALAQNFEVITSSLAKKMMTEHEPVLVEKMDRNNCYVYKIDSKGYLIYSPISMYSIFFKKLKSLESIQKIEHLPIEVETDDIRELEQEKLTNIPQHINSYINELETKFNLNLSDFSNVEIINQLDNKIYEFGIDNLSERDVFIISLYLDEFFRKNTDTYWAIEKVYTLKTYWIPYLKRKESNKEYSFYRSIFKSYSENESGYLNLKLNYLLQMAEYKELSPLSQEHINFIKSFNVN
jgi:hypothetical protein